MQENIKIKDLTLAGFLEQHANNINRLLSESGPKRLYNLSVPHLAILLALSKSPFIAVEDSPESAAVLYNDLQFFSSLLKTSEISEGRLSRSEASFLPPFSAPEDAGERASVLRHFSKNSNTSIVTSLEGCRTGFNISDLDFSLLVLRKKMEMERGMLRQLLLSLGYRKVSVVVEHGEFSERGWLFDIYPSTGESPVRVEFFGDEIELLRTFDIETQRSIKEIQEVAVFPALEADAKSGSVFDFMVNRDTDVFFASEIPESFPLDRRHITVSHLPFAGEGTDAGELNIKGLGILPEERKEISDFPAALVNSGLRVLLVLQSEAQAERLKDIMKDNDVIAPIIDLHRSASYEGQICITSGKLSSGLNMAGFLILSDREIFGERPAHRPIKKSKVAKLLLSMDDLVPGDYIVHKDHGIGKFIGLQRQRTEDYAEDMITLEYAGGDRVYMPLQGIGSLQKYSAGEDHVPSMDRLGSKRWLSTKQKVRKGIEEMAEKLLKLYAERKAARGYVFSEDTPMHREFDGFFPYEETPDQIKALEEIRKHMNSDVPMDMLLCGDVGYGKTEMAVRAAFRAVYDGKQVAVLVPTTLLAEQHYRTFRTRFSGFPVNIDYLSRFKNKADVKKCMEAAARGEIDIVVSTHMLLNKSVKFHDLGLLIIDEEHRFGVAQKERLKELKTGVDVLTLTATPIPRTLHMSLAGIREMCTIETPPEERLAVRTIVTAFNDRTIKEAIERELKRDGQVFFVHNRIMDMEKMSSYLRKLVPHARIAVAHGRMREVEMERIMLGFLNRETDILLCTAIIGSGLDIPTANTILVDRADAFGLSDLYQLRGRVGRGNVQAFAYCLIPGEDIITDDAKKRLRAIQEMSYLGAGLRLALKDLEIRGTGNLLGAEQSGHIYKVGFDMYMEMMEKAVAELKGEPVVEEIEPQIRLRLSAFIPEEYIQDISLRLSIYKRISSAKTIEALLELVGEITDRFGNMPAEVKNLVHVMKVKMLSKRLYITKVSETDGRCRFFFLMDTEGGLRMPEDFFDRLMKVLFAMMSGAGSRRKGAIRFLPDGFELDTHGMEAGDSVSAIVDMLKAISEKLKPIQTHSVPPDIA